jgi:pyridoxal 5'-phosphate synthase pdxT subunit
MLKVGVLALQGDFREHLRALDSVGASARTVRLPRDLEGLDGLVIPGGESTTMRRLMGAYNLSEPLRAFAQAGKAVYGTCAGCIILAREVDGEEPPELALMDIAVSRNAYGRQVDSFESEVAAPAIGPAPLHAVFIRAPRIERIGPNVEALARAEDGTVVAARQGHLLVTTFHPELTEDYRVHRYFLEELVAAAGEQVATT